MIFSSLKLASISDIHLGNPRNDASFIINNLYKAFPRNAKTASLDVLVIAGDVYDRLLTLPQEETHEIDKWIIYTLKLAKDYDIDIWLVRGTNSHDRDQSKRFVLLNDSLNIGANLYYRDVLDIVWMPKFGINVLFVPDEWLGNDPDKTLEQVYAEMADRGISKVDFAVMHGQFEYQLPAVVKAPKHSSQAYLAIVKYLIFIGHVHIFTQNDRIIAQGSFDRISHGEEGPKGHVVATVRSEDDFEIEFVENEGARTFKSIDCQDLDLAQCDELITEVVKNVEAFSFIRVRANKGNPILQAEKHYSDLNPLINWTFEPNKDSAKVLQQQLDLQKAVVYTPIVILRDNIEQLVANKLNEQNVSADVFERAMMKLKELR